MQKRSQPRQGKSKKLFAATADRTHKFNLQSSAGLKRGGIRL